MPLRMTVSAGKQSGFDAVAALFDCGVGQTDNGNNGFFTAPGCIEFNLHGNGVNTRKRAGKSSGQHNFINPRFDKQISLQIHESCVFYKCGNKKKSKIRRESANSLRKTSVTEEEPCP